MKSFDCVNEFKDAIETLSDYYDELYERLKAFEKSIRESVEFIG